MSTIYICDCLKEYNSPGLVQSCIRMHPVPHSNIPPERFKTVGDLDCIAEQRLAEIYEMGYESVEDWYLSCEIEEYFDIFMDGVSIEAIHVIYNTDLLRNPKILIKLKKELLIKEVL